jgi:hypothetical protein
VLATRSRVERRACAAVPVQIAVEPGGLKSERADEIEDHQPEAGELAG